MLPHNSTKPLKAVPLQCLVRLRRFLPKSCRTSGTTAPWTAAKSRHALRSKDRRRPASMPTSRILHSSGTSSKRSALVGIPFCRTIKAWRGAMAARRGLMAYRRRHRCLVPCRISTPKINRRICENSSCVIRRICECLVVATERHQHQTNNENENQPHRQIRSLRP